jgi:hypothetical protein
MFARYVACSVRKVVKSRVSGWAVDALVRKFSPWVDAAEGPNWVEGLGPK